MAKRSRNSAMTYLRYHGYRVTAHNVVQTASSNARGFLCAIASSVRAGPDGVLRSCSHSCRVRTDTPSNRANSVWDKPTRARVSATGGYVSTRPVCPRLSSRSPSRISAPILRVFAFFIVNLLADLSEYMLGNVLCDIFGIEGKQPNDILPHPYIEMTRSPPRFPRPGSDHLSLRSPPEPGITGPASGAEARVACNWRCESSDKYCSTSLVNNLDSTNVIIAINIRQRRIFGKQEYRS